MNRTASYLVGVALQRMAIVIALDLAHLHPDSSPHTPLPRHRRQALRLRRLTDNRQRTLTRASVRILGTTPSPPAATAAPASRDTPPTGDRSPGPPGPRGTWPRR